MNNRFQTVEYQCSFAACGLFRSSWLLYLCLLFNVLIFNHLNPFLDLFRVTGFCLFF